MEIGKWSVPPTVKEPAQQPFGKESRLSAKGHTVRQLPLIDEQRWRLARRSLGEGGRGKVDGALDDAIIMRPVASPARARSKA